MKLAIKINIIFFFLLLSGIGSAQDENKVLAKIGSGVITVEEFKTRFEFMPHLNYSDSNIDSIKKEFLYSLIAERLWAMEADELQLDTIETIRLSLQSLKNLFIKDELYKQEVESKIIVSNDEISKGISRVTRILNTSIITSPDSEKIWELYNTFQTGVKYDSVLMSMGMPQKPFEVKYGSIEDEAIEDILYSLKINEISKPIKFKYNWFIFKLIDDQQDVSIDPSKDHAKNIVINKLKDRKSQKIGRLFLDNLLGGKSITADRRLFDVVSEKLVEVIKTRLEKSQTDSLTDIQILETDIFRVLSLINNNDLGAAFIKMENTPLTLKSFLYYLIYQKVYFNSLSTNNVKIVLNRAVKEFIEDETIVREGYKRGLENLPAVKDDLQIWENYYLAEVLMNSYTDSIKISDNEIEDYINTKNNLSDAGLQLNIVEILTDNIDDIDNILKEVNNGKDFKYLASIYNKREWTKPTNGEWGLFNVSSGGEIGRKAAGLEIGQIYGPIKVPEGYSMFKLIDKRQNVSTEQTISDKEDIKFIRVKLALSKMDLLLNQKTISLAEKFGMSLNTQLLGSVETSELNTFTYRLIGFGGKIAALPITIPMYDWYKQYEKIKDIP